MNCTRLWCQYPGEKEHLINEITAVSKFDTVKWPSGAHRHEHKDQRVIAEELIQGWKTFGNHPAGTTYRIEHSDHTIMNGPTLDETVRKAGIPNFVGFA
jgi:hypothetical protein